MLAVAGMFASSSVQAEMPVVGIHDSELTRALETMPATNGTPSGTGTTGFQWWVNNWHYFVMPDSVKEALRSDGTSFTAISDANISAGALLDSNNLPVIPIVISLASEAIRDDEIPRLANYVAAGGVLFVGSSSFTRNTNGTSRGDFAFANAMGIHMATAGLTNWGFDSTFSKVSNHPLLAHIPGGQLTWQMPMSADEISWPEANHVGNPPTGLPHLTWMVAASDATVIAVGDSRPYILMKQFGKGWFIYDAAMQPLLGHGGWAPGMYAYGIIRNAIQWAAASAKLPVTRLSTWPYQYDAAVIFRHDMEAIPAYIQAIESSAQFEAAHGAKGDYFFCTGELREDMGNPAATIASLQRAVTNYGATIGPHNGGLVNPNPYNPPLGTNDYDYWHWGPDEVLDSVVSGYPNGQAFALRSMSNSFVDIQTWLPGTNNGGGMRFWVAPYFNATREGSLQIQEQLGIKATGDDKLGPFPHFTLSTQTPDKRYAFVTLPVNEWYLGTQVAQSMENGHTISSVHDLVDAYYSLGGLINLYSHSSSDGTGPAGAVASEYVTYSLSKPQIWTANTLDIYNWWLKRQAVQITPTYATNGNQCITTFVISGASDTNTAVELLAPSSSFTGLQVFTNGAAAGTNFYRVNGSLVKVRAGIAVTNIQVRYSIPPTAQDDLYQGQQGVALTVPAPGILGNDMAGIAGGTLTASLATAPAHGTLNLNTNGGFTYTPAAGFAGVDNFTYRASDKSTSSAPAVVTLLIPPTGDLFFDDFSRGTNASPLAPWVQELGTWTIGNGTLTGAGPLSSYDYAFYSNTNWTDYAVQAQMRFSDANGWAGGIGGRLDPVSGAHYGAWVYPDGSQGGPNVLKLIKFEGWTSWSFTPMAQINLPSVGTNLHTLAINFQGPNITVSWDGVQQIVATDNNVDSVAPYLSGGITADMYTDALGYQVSYDNFVVTPLGAPVITSQPQSRTNATGTTATFSVTATGSGLNYQWSKGTAAIAGATSSTLTLTNVSQANAGSYSVIVSNAAGSATSAAATLTILDLPVITGQPVSVTNLAGTTATFSVTASGTNLSYQWLKGSASVGGATTATLTLVNVSSLDAATYSAVVANAAGSVTSAPATLTVITANGSATPLFADDFTRPTNGTIAPWIAQSGAWTATGGVMIVTNSLQSYSHAYITNMWTNYAVQARFSLPTNAYGGGLGGRLNPANGAHYAAWIYPENSAGGSRMLKLIKFQSWTTWGYQGVSFAPMQQVSLAGVGTNYHTLKLGFYANRIAVYLDGVQVMSVTDVEAAPLLSGSICADMWTDTRAYTMSMDDVVVNTLVVGDSYVVNQGATLTVPAPGVLANDTPVYGSNLTAILLGGTTHGTVNLSASGGFTYTPASGFAGPDSFTYQGNDGLTNLGAGVVNITVNAMNAAPTITSQPTSRTNAAGTVATFTVGASGNAPLSYRWSRNGAALSDGGNVSGSASSTLTVSNVLGGDAGSYTVVVTNSLGTATSAPAILTVLDPVITAQPVSRTNNAGTTATFSVTANGTTPNYQWLKNGAAMPGATLAALTLNGVTQTNAGSYSVVVSNAFGNITSSTATLTIIDPPSIVTQPASRTNNAGTPASFTVVASGTAPAYQWFKNGTNALVNGGNISGATSATLSLASVLSGDAGNYSVLISNTAGSVTSVPAVLTIVGTNPAPLFSDNFTRSTDPGPLTPWINRAGTWRVTSGALKGGPNTLQSYANVYITNSWTNYSVQARVQFPAGAYGGGIGGCVNRANGAHYAAWIYPEGSPGGSSVLKLIKFQTWTTWGYQGVSFAPMQQVALAGVGTNYHTLMLAFSGSQIAVYFDTNQVISMTDAEATTYQSGSISVDMWTGSTAYAMNVDDVVVNPVGAGGANALLALGVNVVSLVIPTQIQGVPPQIQSLNLSNGVATITWSAVPGLVYQVQYSDTLGGDWRALPTEVQALGTTATLTDAVSNAPQRFYQIVVVQ